MKLISNAIVYKAEIPQDTSLLHNHLAEKSFTPPGPFQARSYGFVPVSEHSGCRLVETFDGGLAFRVRVDDKILPASVIRARTDERIKSIEDERGAKLGKKARKQVKDQVIDDLLQVAMVKTTAMITCFYDFGSGYLIIPVTNKSLADICTTLLVTAVGSVKTETIHVSDVKHGLTTRLKTWIEDLSDDPMDTFGDFEPVDQVVLAFEKRQISIRMTSLQGANDGIREALKNGFSVNALGLSLPGQYDLRLTHDFRLRGIDHFYDVSDDDENEWLWWAHAAKQVGNVVHATNELVKLLSYREPGEKAAEEAAEAAA